MGWKAIDIPDLDGKVAVVTGANSGLGFEASKELARKGVTVVMATRNLDKGQQAADRIKAEIPAADLELHQLDLGSLESVHAFVKGVLAEHDSIDILLNNAGIMAAPARETADGFESQVGTNHFGHFVLTQELMPALERAAAARVVTTTSIARTRGRALTEETTRIRDGYDAWQAYADSKNANYQFGIELARRLEAAGSSVASLVAHPGLSNTNLQAASVQNAGAGFQGRLWHVMARYMGMSSADGALPLLRAATDPEAHNGEFYGPRWNLRGGPVALKVSEESAPQADTARMWDISQSQTDTMFDLGSSH